MVYAMALRCNAYVHIVGSLWISGEHEIERKGEWRKEGRERDGGRGRGR